MKQTGRYSPLRYPGGKSKLAKFIKAIVTANGLQDGTYVEPFAGGAGIALELLCENYVRSIKINDLSPTIYAVWNAMLNETARFCDDVSAVELSVAEWDRQKRIFEGERKKAAPSLYELGFSTFYLNRTNRSGILNGGIIGGRSQASAWGIDARFNRQELIARIDLIGSMRNRIDISCLDAIEFVSKIRAGNCFRTLMYLDPPYFIKGRQLYLDYYKGSDHANLARAIKGQEQPFSWIVSYDNVNPIHEIYSGTSFVEYDIHYSARRASVGSEVIFFGPGLDIPCPENYLHVTKALAA